jgi:hypothetical protein
MNFASLLKKELHVFHLLLKHPENQEVGDKTCKCVSYTENPLYQIKLSLLAQSEGITHRTPFIEKEAKNGKN